MYADMRAQIGLIKKKIHQKLISFNGIKMSNLFLQSTTGGESSSASQATSSTVAATFRTSPAFPSGIPGKNVLVAVPIKHYELHCSNCSVQFLCTTSLTSFSGKLYAGIRT